MMNPCGIDAPLQITNSPTGEILSPDYPDNYPNDANCEWHIQVDDGCVVELIFVEFDVEDG